MISMTLDKVMRFVRPRRAAILDCVAEIEFGSFDLADKFVFWVRKPGKRYEFVCADAGGLAHVTFGESLSEGRRDLEAMSEEGIVSREPEETYGILVGLNLILPFSWEKRVCLTALGLAVSISDRLGGTDELVPISRMVERLLMKVGLKKVQALVGPERIAFAGLGDIAPWDKSAMIDGLSLDLSVVRSATSAIAAYPALRAAIGLHASRLPAGSRSPAETVLNVLEAGGVDRERRGLLEARLRGVDCGHELPPECIVDLGRLPRDWVPRETDLDGWFQLLCILPTISRAEENTGVPVEEICRHAGGHWRRFVDRIYAAAGDGWDGAARNRHRDGSKGFCVSFEAARDIRDMRDGFVNDLGCAILARAGEDGMCMTGAASIARKALFEGRGLVRILELSKRWHRRGLHVQEPQDMSWDPALPTWSDPASGLVLVPLVTSEELAREGGAGVDPQGVLGLRHCVAGRWRRCIEGKSRIVSVRREAGDGRFERISTLEVRLDGGSVRVMSEHRGSGNRQPPVEAVEAVGRYMAEMEAGRIAIDRKSLQAAWYRRDPVTVADICGYDWRDDSQMQKAIDAWAPYLQRRLRGLGPDDLVRALGYEVPEAV